MSKEVGRGVLLRARDELARLLQPVELALDRPDDLRLRRGDAVPLPESVRIPRRLIAPGATLAAVSVAMFVGAGWLFPLADRAAAGLVRVGPYVEAVLR